MLAYEGLTAFTLEAGFLGVLLFGRKLVPRWAHFCSALLVAFGTLFSSFWILVDQQLDADARRAIAWSMAVSIRPDWMAIIFNRLLPLSPHAYGGRPFMSPPALWCWAVGAWLLRAERIRRRRPR